MPEPRILTVLHTNDFHNHLNARQADHIKRRKIESGADTLLVDAGDAISAGNVGVRIGGEPILHVMNETGYDCMTMGNREFHVADSLLRHKIANAAFPILCANIRYQKDSGAELPVTPFVRKTTENGLRVAVIGVTVPMVTEKMTARALSAYVFDDPADVVCRYVAMLREETDVLIALTHIGIKEDQRLANSCPQLDLIVGGHSHVVLTEAQYVGAVPIVQAGWFGHYLGATELAVSSSKVELRSSSLEDLRLLEGKPT